MTTETHTQSSTHTAQIPFGAKLKTAREAAKLERKDAAVQLRLSEKILEMIENDSYPPHLPPTFIRGYLRSYAKFLEIPPNEINTAVRSLKFDPVTPTLPTLQPIQTKPVTSGHYFMQFFTYAIFFTLLSLVGIWWFSHSATPTPIETQTLLPPPKNEAVNNLTSSTSDHFNANATSQNITHTSTPIATNTTTNQSATTIAQPSSTTPPVVAKPNEQTANSYADTEPDNDVTAADDKNASNTEDETD